MHIDIMQAAGNCECAQLGCVPIEKGIKLVTSSKS